MQDRPVYSFNEDPLEIVLIVDELAVEHFLPQSLCVLRQCHV